MTTIDISSLVADAVDKKLAELVVDRRPIALDLKAAMDYSGLSKTSLNRLLAEEKIVARKEGVKNLFLRESLDRYINSLPAWGSR
ncbi:helix-turn-helix domain-containing protein [Nocardia flavorosea]|uniref:helix-turn-helix domain-containing protein n=1 Tax=Nocardia flavorosea TaxID=53429 RepID=UPI001893BECE|nr:helix-turn-helix domain-containing protein [Nocardia flavorosea]MBF6350332.1 helix-turn-helix domain-containing protein [Nocardia flavorosea]